MKLIKKIIYFALVVNLILTSCKNNEEGIVKKETKHHNTTKEKNSIILKSIDKKTKEIVITSDPNKLVDVTVRFSGNKNISRLYLTKNVYSEAKGASPYQFSDLGQKKKDGSVELSKQNQKEFTHKFQFKTPKKKNDIVEYHLWVTTKRGDFRNASKHNAINDRALCKVIIKSGKDVKLKPITLKTFSSIVLKNSTSKGESESYVFSTFDGKIHKLDEDKEYASYWDFGYYLGNYNSLLSQYHGHNGNGGHFLSIRRYLNAVRYQNLITSIKKRLKERGINHEELNYTSYNLNNRTIADFDAIKKGSDLDNLLGKKGVKFYPQSKASKISKGFVKEFINDYGEKGIIKVTNFVPGQNGQVEFDIKIQVREEPFMKKANIYL